MHWDKRDAQDLDNQASRPANELCGPLELQMKRLFVRTSLSVPEWVAAPLFLSRLFLLLFCCFLCCTEIGREKHEENLIVSTAQEGTCCKRSEGGDRDQDSRRFVTKKGRQKRGQYKYKSGGNYMISG